MCHANLGPDSSGTRNRRRLEHCSISQPETGVHVTEMMIYRRLLFIFVISCKQSVNSRVDLQLFTNYVAFSHVYFQSQKFSFQTYMVRKTGAENRRQKMESIYGADFWSVYHAYSRTSAYKEPTPPSRLHTVT